MSNNMGPRAVPLERLERNPLITEAGFRTLNSIAQHPAAPKWNYFVGDRVEAEDLAEIERFRERTYEGRRAWGPAPPPAILEWVREMREKSPAFRERLPEGFDLEKDWGYIPCLTREDVAVRPELILPLDADLSRLIVYDTSGTSGHAIAVPHHPRDNAQNLPLIEFALGRHGLTFDFGPEAVACFCVSARHTTVVFPNVFSVWNQAGFAKVNFHPNHWPRLADAERFFREMAPLFLTGDPVGFAEMMRWGVPKGPAALISTAVDLEDGLKSLLEERYRAPVINWYSTTETGPVAYACPQGEMHVLPTDIYVEVVDEEGFPVPPGKLGELAVTGGRNPYLPLLRYLTGDRGRMAFDACPCGDPLPRVVGLEGRPAVHFRAGDGSAVNQVDIGRLLRGAFVFVQHQFVQRADGSCDLKIRPAPGFRPDTTQAARLMAELFGPDVEIRVVIDERLGEETGGKVVPYVNENVG